MMHTYVRLNDDTILTIFGEDSSKELYKCYPLDKTDDTPIILVSYDDVKVIDTNYKYITRNIE